MSDFTQGTSAAGKELYELQPIASAWALQRGKLGSGFSAMQALSRVAYQGDDIVSVNLTYDLENGIVEQGNDEGFRLANQGEPSSHPGTTRTKLIGFGDYGREQTIDPLDASLRGQDKAQVGAMKSAGKLAVIMERHLATLIAGSTTGWASGTDVAAAASWETHTTDIVDQLGDLLVTFDAKNTLVSHVPNAIHMSRKAWLALIQNTSMVGQQGGNVGAGPKGAMALETLSGLGFDHVFVGPTSLFAGYVNVFYWSDEPRAVPASLLLCHQGAADEPVRVSERAIGHRRMGYYSYITGRMTTIPEWGIRLTGAVS